MEHQQTRTFEITGLSATRAHDAPSLIFAKRICGDVTPAKIVFVDLVVVPPGAEIGLHTHSVDSREVYIVLSGTGEMRLGPETIEVGEGSVLANEPGGQHSLRNIGADDILMVVIDTKVDR